MPSSVIAHYAYHEEKEILELTFVSGLIYHYCSVPVSIYEGLKHSKSKGIYFNSFIKDKFKFQRIK